MRRGKGDLSPRPLIIRASTSATRTGPPLILKVLLECCLWWCCLYSQWTRFEDKCQSCGGYISWEFICKHLCWPKEYTCKCLEAVRFFGCLEWSGNSCVQAEREYLGFGRLALLSVPCNLVAKDLLVHENLNVYISHHCSKIAIVKKTFLFFSTVYGAYIYRKVQ